MAAPPATLSKQRTHGLTLRTPYSCTSAQVGGLLDSVNLAVLYRVCMNAFFVIIWLIKQEAHEWTQNSAKQVHHRLPQVECCFLKQQSWIKLLSRKYEAGISGDCITVTVQHLHYVADRVSRTVKWRRLWQSCYEIVNPELDF